ncbi:hypothetical protein ACFQUU_10685 [Herbaspirillum sp. GCM10030257]|uniref:hypothetical protein n=1 Tax=Herbaspirillum sp. GCM10030257 TaxID=3273393 RepID=UPI003618C5F4
MKKNGGGIAALNQQRAIQNIKTKIGILEHWVSQGIPRRYNEAGQPMLSSGLHELDYFPKSLRQFNLWDGSQNCSETLRAFPIFRKNANDTLRIHTSLRQCVQKLIAELRRKRKEQSYIEKPDTLNSLRSQLVIEKGRLRLLEKELYNHRKQMKILQGENLRLTELVELASEESHRAISELQDDLNSAREQNAALVRRIQQVLPLKNLKP